MLAGTLLVHIVQDKTAVWCWMVILVGVHLFTNYCGVRCVRMRTLNRQRATIVFREWLDTGSVLSPTEVAKRESILRYARGNVSSKSGDYSGLCDFGTYGDVMTFKPWGYQRYVFDTDDYYMGIWHWGPTFYIRIALKEGTRSPNDPLLAWFDAVTHAYHFDNALKDGLDSHYESDLPAGHVSRETKLAVLEALRAKGWDVEDRALETRIPVRVRIGDGKKGM
jgi:hypothetical protein